MKFVMILSMFFILKTTASPNEKGKPIRLTGVVLDQQTKQPVAFAMITCYNETDLSIISSTQADTQGVFMLTIPQGINLKIKVDFLGYMPYVFQHVNTGKDNDLGVVLLQSNSRELQTIEIVAEKAQIQFAPDKKIYHVEKDLLSGAGATAQSILQNVPGVSIEQDGTLNLRGSSNVRILVNSKPSSVTGSSKADILKQIPANTIDRIEVITNPGANFDAEGMVGIINVVLKKQRNDGFNAQINGTAGTNDKYFGGLSINYNIKKFNFFVNADNRFTIVDNRADVDQYRNFVKPEFFLQEITVRNKEQNYNYKGGIDFNPDEKNNFTFYTLQNRNYYNGQFSTRYDSLDKFKLVHSSYNNHSQINDDSYNADYTLNYKHIFSEGETITADAIYSGNEANALTLARQSVSTPEPAQYINNRNVQKNFLFQSDYARILPENKGKLEAGVRSAVRNIHTDIVYHEFNHDHQQYVADSARSNRFSFEERIQTLYGQYTNKWKEIVCQFGVRTEVTHIKSELLNNKTSFPQNYFLFFPNTSFSRKLKSGQQLSLSFNRRINRPADYLLIPFPDYSDYRNLRTGNPFLRAELVNSYEVGYNKNADKYSFSASFYYRHIGNVIRRIYSLQSDGLSNQSYTNVGQADNYGVEASVTANPFHFMSFTGNVNYYHSVITSHDIQTFDANCLFGKLTTVFTLPYKIKMQVIGNYRSPYNILGGYILQQTYMDIGIKKEITKEKITITLRISDVLDSQRFRVDRFGAGYFVHGNYKDETRIVYLGFTYQINNFRFKPQKSIEKSNGNTEMRD